MTETRKTRKIRTSSCVLPMDEICMKCRGELFTENENERQQTVIKTFESLPPDCVSSPMDGIKCPFITGAAYVNGIHTHRIPQHNC